ncbi:Uncharacterised protein [Vibrio cholerae]|uniref:Uncharacterized protein n=1 Tax=Vibrio cholerae TaxID=666 RepID=A0A655X324_VIBCL|nr:Uncharacterised protein [Vibrio cholerae]
MCTIRQHSLHDAREDIQQAGRALCCHAIVFSQLFSHPATHNDGNRVVRSAHIGQCHQACNPQFTGSHFLYITV